MKNSILRYGLIGGLIMFAIGMGQWIFFKDVVSYKTAEIVGYSSMVIGLMSVFFAIRKYRDDHLDGVISFKEAFKVGILTTLIPAGIAFLQSVIFFYTYAQEFKQWALNDLKVNQPEQYEVFVKQMEQMPSYIESPFFQGALMFVTVFLIGLIITVLSSMILSKKRS